MSDEHHQQKRIGVGMMIAAWVVVLLIAAYFFEGMLDRQHNPNQNLVSVESGTQSEVILKRNKFGHYVASGTINDQAVVFFLDTGASDVSIPARVADRLGLQRGAPTTYHTANGTITAYRTELDRVRLGGIVLRDVNASINPAIDAEEILLGMSFLKHLEFTQRGDTLTLRQYQ